MSRRTKYYAKLGVAIVIMQASAIAIGMAGLKGYSLPLSFLVALTFFWVVWPDVWHPSELTTGELRFVKYAQIVIFCVLLVSISAMIQFSG